MVEQEGHGVRKDFAQQPACQVPRIACPHSLYGVAPHELRKDGVYPVAKPAEQGTSLGIRVELLGGVRGQKLDAYRRQLLLGLRRVVVAVPDDQAGGGLDEFGDDAQLVSVGRSHRQTSYDTRPTDPRVHPEAIEGLLEEGVLAEGGLAPKAPAER